MLAKQEQLCTFFIDIHSVKKWILLNSWWDKSFQTEGI
jgi:hypothetical protein